MPNFRSQISDIRYQVKSLTTHYSLPTTSFGFTLIELMVVVSIMAVLGGVGLTMYRRPTGNAEDAKKKADIEAIAKAYEVNYDQRTRNYRALTAGDFANGALPTSPDGTNYSFDEGPGISGASAGIANNRAFRICATLSDGSRYCKTSAYAPATTLTPIPTNSPTPTITPTITPTRIPTLTPIPYSAPADSPVYTVPVCSTTVCSCIEPGNVYVDCSSASAQATNCAQRWPPGCTPP